VATFLCGTLSGIMLAGSGQDAMRQGAALRGAAAPAPMAPRVEPRPFAAEQPPVFSASSTVGGTTVSMNVPGTRPAPPAPPAPPPPPPPRVPGGEDKPVF
jgi:hypothetical protein